MACALYGGQDTVIEDAAAFGLAVAEWKGEVEVWAEHEETLDVFRAMATQWHVDFFSGRRIGLRYEAIPVTLDLLELRETNRAALFAGLRVMESAVMAMEAKRRRA